MQDAHPRVLTALLQLGLGVQMYWHFGSRFLIASLITHGFHCSSSEVEKCEWSADVNQGLHILGFLLELFVQYVNDNVDHYARTLGVWTLKRLIHLVRNLLISNMKFYQRNATQENPQSRSRESGYGPVCLGYVKRRPPGAVTHHVASCG